ncbi:MAG: hypothetical protein NC548_22890 [Lachnospiraceae bacterium]|nr:hypothetical protein [Lachnospiraceae bacterium]
MIKPYFKTRKLYVNDAIITGFSERILLDEAEAQTNETILTWDDIPSLIHEFGLLTDLRLYRIPKKGFKLYSSEYIISQWKEPDLKFIHRISFTEWNASLQDILDYPDTEMAIKYLKEKFENPIDKLIKK